MKHIETYHTDLLNGTGLREVLFLSGCEHHCKGCFNEFTWDPNTESAREFTDDDYNELVNNLRKPYCSGLTLSGGDPLSIYNFDGVYKLLNRLRDDIKDLNVWLYTGYTYEQIMGAKHKDGRIFEDNIRRSILDKVDVLVDGRFIESLKSPDKPWVGSSNQRVIDMNKTRKEGNVVLYKEA